MSKRKPWGYWTPDRCHEEFKKYKTKKDVIKNNKTAYNAAEKLGIFDQVSSHMFKRYPSGENHHSFSDLTGKKFGKLTVLKLCKFINGRSLWECECDCGNIKNISSSCLVQGLTKSCGCLRTNLIKIQETSWNYVYSIHKSNRDTKGFLQEDIFKNLSSKNCFYCDMPPRKYNRYIKSNGDFGSGSKKISKEVINKSWIECNGIDRVDNNLRYKPSNSVSCCSNCNMAKRGQSIYKWLSYLEYLMKDPGYAARKLEELVKMGIKVPPKSEDNT